MWHLHDGWESSHVGLQSDLFWAMWLPEQLMYEKKYYFNQCSWVFWEMHVNSHFCSKTQWQMFLLLSGRSAGAHLDGHQHGISIQITINLGKTFLCISCLRKTHVTWILARGFVYWPFFSQILDLIYWTVLVFILIYWMAWHWKPAIIFNIH